MQIPRPAASIVIPSRDRPDKLARCLSALQEQETEVLFEILVVDDGSVPPVALPDVSHPTILSVVAIRRDGTGPARARNAGIERARGELILFTDDDTIPGPHWIETAVSFLTSHPDHVGVEGPTITPAYDPLYFHSVRASAPGSFLTCNVAYRREAIEEVGGFSEMFPSAHAEDLDLGFRIARLGPTGYESRMVVLHPPMPTTLLGEIRRGRQLVSDGYLFRRHPERYPWSRFLSPAGYALFLNAKHWGYCLLRDYYRVGNSPRRAVRFVVLAAGYSAVGAVAVVQDALRRARRRRASLQP